MSVTSLKNHMLSSDLSRNFQRHNWSKISTGNRLLLSAEAVQTPTNCTPTSTCRLVIHSRDVRIAIIHQGLTEYLSHTFYSKDSGNCLQTIQHLTYIVYIRWKSSFTQYIYRVSSNKSVRFSPWAAPLALGWSRSRLVSSSKSEARLNMETVSWPSIKRQVLFI